MKFIKMEGIGNDFIVTNEIPPDNETRYSVFASQVCDRRRGVGGDGLIFILPSERADFRMRIFNSDGSEAEMCGNGIRCCAKYIEMMNMSKSSELAIETMAGIIGTETLPDEMVRVDMGPPHLVPDEVPVLFEGAKMVNQPVDVHDRTFLVTAVSMGNPHAVIYTDTLSDDLVHGWGPLLETHSMFPRKTNVEFIKILSDEEIQMRVWERGCGETEACGTGACAAVVSGIVNGLHGKKVTVHLPGGDLFIEWGGEDNEPVLMTGAARKTFVGEVF